MKALGGIASRPGKAGAALHGVGTIEASTGFPRKVNHTVSSSTRLWGGREALERKAEGVGVAGVDQDAVGQHITTDEPLDDLTLQGHFDHGNDRDHDAIGERQGHIVHVTGVRRR